MEFFRILLGPFEAIIRIFYGVFLLFKNLFTRGKSALSHTTPQEKTVTKKRSRKERKAKIKELRTEYKNKK